jgi:hypothetical protein
VAQQVVHEVHEHLCVCGGGGQQGRRQERWFVEKKEEQAEK